MLRVILIGGTSHVGKSTLAQELATPTWSNVSTDSLARHPGRPWPVVPPHVAEHYLKLSREAIFQFLLIHHENMWPGIRDMVTRHASNHDTGRLLLEGSALRPEYVADLNLSHIEAAWLTGSDDLIRARIFQASGFNDATPERRRMIERFADRSLMDNNRITEAAARLGLNCVDVERREDIDAFTSTCRHALSSPACDQGEEAPSPPPGALGVHGYEP